MYKIKITNLQGCTNFLNNYHQLGEVLEISDSMIRVCRPFVKVLKHYRVMRTRKKCPTCGHIKTVKIEEKVIR